MCWASSSPQQSYPLDRATELHHPLLSERVKLCPRPPLLLLIGNPLVASHSDGSDSLANAWPLTANRSPATPCTRILIADDQPLIRIGLHTLLSNELDLEVVGEVARGDEVESAIDRLAPNLLILDITLPGLDAIGTTRHLTKHHTEVQILILTACDDQEVILGLLEAGVTGYALKADSPASLLLAIRTVAKGHTWISSRVANVLVSKPVAPWAPPMVSQSLPALTGREREILALVGQGLSNRQIAETLCITRGTVRSHLNRVYGKAGWDGRSQAMHYAMIHGLVSGPPEE